MYNVGSSNKTYIYQRNILGDIIGIFDDKGNQVAKYEYDSYGNCTISSEYKDSEIAKINPFRYRGYYYDKETGLYYLNSRYYDPETGRFISPDTLTILDETRSQINGLNLYMYCGDNPIMSVDPSGMAWWEFWKWDWGMIADIAITTISVGLGIIVGTLMGIALFASIAPLGLLTTIGVGLLSLGTGFLTGMAVTGMVNFEVNFMYYTLSPERKTDITSDSYSKNGTRYISRWDRLDYAKSKTKETWFNLNAWMYYSEYNAHMYSWFALGWAHEKNLGIFSEFAARSRDAKINVGELDGDWRVNLAIFFFGILGI